MKKPIAAILAVLLSVFLLCPALAETEAESEPEGGLQQKVNSCDDCGIIGISTANDECIDLNGKTVMIQMKNNCGLSFYGAESAIELTRDEETGTACIIVGDLEKCLKIAGQLEHNTRVVTIALLSDITLENDIKLLEGWFLAVDNDLTIDLNGHKLSQVEYNGGCNEPIIIVYGGTLTVKDSVGSGKIIGNLHGIFVWDGNLVLEGGTISNTCDEELQDYFPSAAIYLDGGEISLKKGVIVKSIKRLMDLDNELYEDVDISELIDDKEPESDVSQQPEETLGREVPTEPETTPKTEATSEPEETSELEDTAEPKETTEPGKTSEPEKTAGPTTTPETEKPAEQQEKTLEKETDTKEMSESEVSQQSDETLEREVPTEPETTPKTEVTSELEETSELEDTSEPKETTELEKTLEPEVTSAPQETSEPDKTSEPKHTSEPKVTTAPDKTQEPKVSPEPEVTSAPEDTPKPDKTSEPKHTSEPKVTTAPDKTQEPKVSPEPEVTPAPEDTPKPDKTPKPDRTPEPTATPAREKQTEKGTAVDVSKPEKNDNSSSSSSGTVAGKSTIIAAAESEKPLSVAVEDTIPSEKQAEAKTVAESVKTDNVIADKAKEFVNELTPAQTEQLKKTAGLPGNVTLQAKAHLEVKAKDIVTENGTTTSIAMDITPMVQIVASNGAKTVVVQEPEKLTVNTASEVTVELPASFANKTVYITHDTREKGGNLNYYYARADENGKLTFISEHGFSPFVFSLTQTEPVISSVSSMLSYSEAVPDLAAVQMSIALPKTGDMTIFQSILSFLGFI